MKLRDAWRPLPWWIKGLLLLDALAGVAVLLGTVSSWKSLMIVWGATLIALDFWASRSKRRSPRLGD